MPRAGTLGPAPELNRFQLSGSCSSVARSSTVPVLAPAWTQVLTRSVRSTLVQPGWQCPSWPLVAVLATQARSPGGWLVHRVAGPTGGLDHTSQPRAWHDADQLE